MLFQKVKFKNWLVLIVLVGSVIWISYPFASDYEAITVTNVVSTLSPSKIAKGYSYAYITTEGGEIRYRKDGGALATASEGHIIHNSSIQLRDRKEIGHFSFIKAVGNSRTTTIKVSYEDTAP